MPAILFVIDKQRHLNGRSQFTILRINDQHVDVVSHHLTIDDAIRAAQSYASQAGFAGLDARIVQRQ